MPRLPLYWLDFVSLSVHEELLWSLIDHHSCLFFTSVHTCLTWPLLILVAVASYINFKNVIVSNIINSAVSRLSRRTFFKNFDVWLATAHTSPFASGIPFIRALSSAVPTRAACTLPVHRISHWKHIICIRWPLGDMMLIDVHHAACEAWQGSISLIRGLC